MVNGFGQGRSEDNFATSTRWTNDLQRARSDRWLYKYGDQEESEESP